MSSTSPLFYLITFWSFEDVLKTFTLIRFMAVKQKLTSSPYHEHRLFHPLKTIFYLSLSSYGTLHFQSGAAAGESLGFWSAGLASGLFASTDLQFLSSHCCVSLIRILTKPRVQIILITFHYGPAGPGILMRSVTSSEDAPDRSYKIDRKSKCIMQPFIFLIFFWCNMTFVFVLWVNDKLLMQQICRKCNMIDKM